MTLKKSGGVFAEGNAYRVLGERGRGGRIFFWCVEEGSHLQKRRAGCWGVVREREGQDIHGCSETEEDCRFSGSERRGA